MPLTDLGQTQIVAGTEAPDLEAFAATELQRYLRMLYGSTVPVVAPVRDGQTPLLLLGSPATNSAYQALGLEQRWPEAPRTRAWS